VSQRASTASGPGDVAVVHADLRHDVHERRRALHIGARVSRCVVERRSIILYSRAASIPRDPTSLLAEGWMGAWPSQRGLLAGAAALALLGGSSARGLAGADPGVPPPTAAESPSDAVESSVVKVFSTVLLPDLYKPWTKQAPQELTGSGVVIEGKRILTAAHVVLYASSVQVQPNLAGDKLSARVEAIAPGIDLAVLRLEDETFFDSHPSLPRERALPDIKDTVLAYGFPTGGSSLSITKGIVSRIEFSPYTPFVRGLRIQIDAAINPGNSGGPAVAGAKMVGLAFAHLGNAENIGYIVPCEEIDLFLEDVADGRYDGKPALFDELQTLENDALRSFLKLDKSVEGVVVHVVDDPDPAYPLKQWDVITRIGDTRIDDQGMIQLGSRLRVSFRYLIQQLAREGKVELTVVRAGRELKLELPVRSRRPIVISDLQGAYPSYFVYGPLVFTTATMQYAAGLAGKSANPMNMLALVSSPLTKRMLDRPAFEGEALVLISSPLFPHKLGKGYGNPVSRVVKAVDGVRIRNLGHLVEVLRDGKQEFVTIECEGRGGEDLVFRRLEAVAATDAILSDNGVRSQGSPDVLAVWNASARASR
jgi:S1-C subfamily serine protease